ncbi:MAG: hypothetical protein FWG34_09795 [Oscillospiraceae bacterium]|nr:hypothetical protein [Oscillospiraceae bacterium]
MENKNEKTRQTSGADERTPSLPQYFSWINNTNEGSTEKQTFVNLDYFKWLYSHYGMKIRIYALDAGNLDGASGTYEKIDGEKLKRQYPQGYAPLVKKAGEFGCRLGVWAGADGFGNTPEEEKERYDLIVGLCKNHGFMLFKFDTVCGILRKEKRGIFKQMIDECRKYSPELIVLNHRNEFGEAEICATTSLLEGRETYIDVHFGNGITAMHHRAGAMGRGLAPGMKRLYEDHGVCVSSCLDYFEDELIVQAFGRSLILAPEIYGNPWFLRDDEQAKLARVYNLHAKYAGILANGLELPESYDKYAVSRGNEKIRFITLQNMSWEDKKTTINLGETIGLKNCKKLKVMKYHPVESYIGTFDYGDDFDVAVPAFRALLLAVFEENEFCKNTFALTGCEYEVTREKEGEPIEINILKTDGGPIKKICGKTEKNAAVLPESCHALDETPQSPVFLGKMRECTVPENAGQLYEATMFKADNNSLESQSAKRSGTTEIPQVKAARDAFFGQETYIFRGCEFENMFDGKKDTYFDANTRCYETRIDGGCLRVDFGEIYGIGRIEIEYFKITSPVREVPEQNLPVLGETSADLQTWAETPLCENTSIESCKAPIVKFSLHTIEYAGGTREKAVYSPRSGKKTQARYFRLPEPMDRIYSVKIFDEFGEEIKMDTCKIRANNMMAPYSKKQMTYAQRLEIKLPETIKIETGDYISAAVNGTYGAESVYCAAADKNNDPIGFTGRAVSYPVNNWEHIVCQSDKNYTYYLKLSAEDTGKEFVFYALATKPAAIDCEIYFCKANRNRRGIELSI